MRDADDADLSHFTQCVVDCSQYYVLISFHSQHFIATSLVNLTVPTIDNIEKNQQ